MIKINFFSANFVTNFARKFANIYFFLFVVGNSQL